MANIEQERALRRDKLLGWGGQCAPIMPNVDIGQDIVLQHGANGWDLARVSGLDALTQDLTLALTTALGSDLFNIQFGFDGVNAIAEESDPLLMRERIRVAIIQVLRKDSRIRRIVDVKVNDANGQLERPVAGMRELNVRVEFETVTGDEAGIEVTRGLPNG